MLTIQQAAERLNVSVSLVYRLVKTGDLPSYEIASCKRISEKDLEAFLANNKRQEARLPAPVNRRF